MISSLKLAGLVDVPVKSIRRNPLNPRREVGDVTRLAASMADVGLLHPILVMESADEYVLLAGERRWTAAGTLDWETIAATTRSAMTAAEQLEILLIEGLQRRGLQADRGGTGISRRWPPKPR